MIYTRQQLEEFENQSLAPYGIRSRDSKGRKYPEEEADFRTRFQRDRERILHTTAFRRLEYKTQVFINHEGDYYRTRLTHSWRLPRSAVRLPAALARIGTWWKPSVARDLGHPPLATAAKLPWPPDEGLRRF